MNSKVVFISLFWFLSPSFGFYFPLLVFISLFFSSHIKFSGKEHTNLTLITLLANDLWVSDFFGVDDYWVLDHSPKWPHSIILAMSSIVLLAITALENSPIPVYQHTNFWQTHKFVFWFRFGHHNGGNKAVFYGEVIQPFCSTTWSWPWWLGRCQFQNPPPTWGRWEKCQKNSRSWLLGVHSSSTILELSKLGLKLCWSVQSFFFSPVWCCFPNSKGSELSLGGIDFDFLYSLFLCFLGHKNLQPCKITYWMTFTSFIFNFPRDLNNALALLGHKHKVPREVKNKGNYRHPINNY